MRAGAGIVRSVLMRRTFSAVVACALLTVALGVAPAVAGKRAALPRRCDGAVRVPESNGQGRTAVLLVHGFLGSPDSFRRGIVGRHDNPRDLLETVAAVDGASAYTFDYSEHASKWVTDQSIAPALAQSIRCLARASGRKVVVVAHSMGGLATRVAQGQVIKGRAVSESVARVITIGTPTQGVLLLTYAKDRLTAFALQTILDNAGELCDEPPDKDRRRLCELLDAADAPATEAMAPDSGQLGALPPWGIDVTVHPIAADLIVRVSVLGVGVDVPLGDIVTTVDSAIADASPGEQPLVVECHTEIDELVDAVDRSLCSHGNELAHPRIIRAVRDQVRAALDQTGKRSSSR